MDNGLKFIYNSKTFNDVISGKFPEDAVKKMNICALQTLVVNLVKYTTCQAGSKPVSIDNNYNKNRPRWWPNDVIFEFESLPNEAKNKDIRMTLLRLVIKCSEFFRNGSFKQVWLPPTNGAKTLWINDENFGSVKTRGVKRTKDIPEVPKNGIKRRNTLTSKNESASLIPESHNRSFKAVVYLHDIFKDAVETNKPLTQQQFLKSFGLNYNNNCGEHQSSAPRFSKLLKLHNCPHVPLSSDVGKAIIKRENYSVPEYSTLKKLERLEWYINRPPPKPTPQHYEVTFTENKVSDLHFYKFPKRQFEANKHYVNFLLKFCKPLKVVIEQEDLISRKRHYDRLKVNVILHRLSSEHVIKYLCKDIKVCVSKNGDDGTSRSRSRRLRLRKQLNS